MVSTFQGSKESNVDLIHNAMSGKEYRGPEQIASHEQIEIFKRHSRCSMEAIHQRKPVTPRSHMQPIKVTARCERSYSSFAKPLTKLYRLLKINIRNKGAIFRYAVGLLVLIILLTSPLLSQTKTQNKASLKYVANNNRSENSTSPQLHGGSHSFFISRLHSQLAANQESDQINSAPYTRLLQASADQVYERALASNDKERHDIVERPAKADFSESDSLKDSKNPEDTTDSQRDLADQELDTEHGEPSASATPKSSLESYSPHETVFGRYHRDVTVELGENPWNQLSGPSSPYRQASSWGDRQFRSLEVWSYQLPAARGSKRITQFCRIFDACRTKRGHVLLPVWMEIHDVQLRQCGVTHPLYIFTNDSREEYSSTMVEERGVQYESLDLLSIQPLRKNRHLFLADSLPALYIFDAVLHFLRRDSKTFSHHCITSSDIQEGLCNHSENLRPAMFVRKEAFATPWSRSYMKLLANPKIVPKGQALQFLNLYAAFPRRRSQKKAQNKAAVCFRSIFTMPGKYGRISPLSLNKDNPFFKINSIQRRAPSIPNDAPRCFLRITLFNPPRENSSVNTAKLKSAIEHLAGQVTGKPNIILRITETDIDNERFNRQIDIMQETNVLVASHGAELSNILFMKEGSHVIEVMPFSYHAGVFAGMARQFSLHHKYHMTRSDSQSFFECLEMFNDDPSDKTSRAMSHLRIAWDNANQEFNNGQRMTSLRLEKPPPEYEAILHLKDCARRQTLRVNTNDLATDILNSAAQLCHRHFD